jgi:glycosyltransferase involved in cell wall biosynthesis
MKDKIIIVSWYGVSDTGGVERVTQYMVEAWKKEYEVEIIDFESIKKKRIYRILLNRHYALDSILVSIYTNKRLKKLGRKNVKVVTQGYNAPFVKADVAFAHGTMRGYKIAMEGKKTKWHFNQIFEKISMNRAKKVIAVGNHVKKELHDLYGVDENKIDVLENCVDTENFKPTNAAPFNQKYNVIFSGRLEFRKGIDRLCEIASIIENKEDMNLTIATPDNKNIEMFKNFNHTKVIVGLRKNEMNNFYNSGNIMYFPSLYEGFEMVTTECLSAGTPVIGNDLGAVGDLYADNQEGVSLLEDDDNENIIKIKTLSDKYRDMDSKNRLHNAMCEKYGLDKYCDKLMKIWR